jgi:Na+-transporting methylmalonyl-CoA/oxaloacetate decarboxylase gamma subunit
MSMEIYLVLAGIGTAVLFLVFLLVVVIWEIRKQNREVEESSS